MEHREQTDFRNFGEPARLLYIYLLLMLVGFFFFLEDFEILGDIKEI